MVYTDKWKNPKVRTKKMMMMITIDKAIHLSIYTLNDLGDLSNLIGSLSRTI